MRLLAALIVLAALGAPASANCLFVTDPCATDRQGNTFITRENLGGGYNTLRNGQVHSQTRETFGGSYEERFRDGGSLLHNRNPYEADPDNSRYLPRERRSIFDPE